MVVKPRLTGVEESQVDPVALVNLACSVLSEHGRYKVISHEDILAALTQGQKAILAGCTETSCMAEIGSAMGAPFLFYSNVGRVGTTLVVTATLIDNRTAAVLQRQSITVQSYERALEAMQVATVRLLGGKAEMSPPPDYGLYIWTSLGAGAAALILGGVGTGMGLHYQDQADSSSDQGDFNDYRDKVDTWNTVALAGYIAGGALLAASLVFYLIEPGDTPIEAGGVAAVPLPEGGMVLQYGFKF